MHTQYELKLVNFQLFSSHQIINVLESYQSVSPLTSMHICCVHHNVWLDLQITNLKYWTNCGSFQDGFCKSSHLIMLIKILGGKNFVVCSEFSKLKKYSYSYECTVISRELREVHLIYKFYGLTVEKSCKTLLYIMKLEASPQSP